MWTIPIVLGNSRTASIMQYDSREQLPTSTLLPVINRPFRQHSSPALPDGQGGRPNFLDADVNKLAQRRQARSSHAQHMLLRRRTWAQWTVLTSRLSFWRSPSAGLFLFVLERSAAICAGLAANPGYLPPTAIAKQIYGRRYFLLIKLNGGTVRPSREFCIRTWEPPPARRKNFHFQFAPLYENCREWYRKRRQRRITGP